MGFTLVLKGRKAVVVGVNANGVALAKFLLKKGALVTLADPRPADQLQAFLQDKLDLTRLTLEAGEYQSRTFETAELILVTPGTPLDLKVFDTARAAGVQILPELEFAALFIDEPVIAIGGTKGKTTVAALTAAILEASGKKIFSNATQPLSEYLNAAKPADCVVAATNAFQLEGVTNFKPATIAFLNLQEDHADRYPNFEFYLAANREILRNVDETTTVIMNSEDANLAHLPGQLTGKILLYGRSELPEGVSGAWATKTTLFVRMPGVSVREFDLKNFRLRGEHHRDNLMAAVLLAMSAGAKPEAVRQAIDVFRTLPGRMEFIKRINSVAFYNDSCAANVQAVIRSLQSFAEPVILIMGGRDRNSDYAPLVPHVRHRVKNLILVGEAKEKINRALGDFTETFLVGTLEEALLMAYQKSRSGDVVLLSPGCDSRDVYSDHEARGTHFKKLIEDISQPRRPMYI